MKIIVIGGTGLIGSKIVNKLREHGHEAVAAAPNTGVNTLTGEGLAEVLKGASVVVDVSNSPSWEDAAVLKFFETSTRNLLTYGAAAGVGHHVGLSVVGTDRLSESGYFRAKIAQEKLIKSGTIPYSIVQATQFFEFLKQLADITFDGKKVRLPDALFQPMAADDVASALGRIAVGQPINGTVEIGGPQPFRIDELVRQRLTSLNDSREVIADPNALYSGARISERTLIPDDGAQLGEIRFADWLKDSASSRRQTCSLRRPRLRRNEPETMADNEFHISEVPDGLVVTGGRLNERVVTKTEGFVTSQAAGEWGMGRYTGARPAPTHDEIGQLAYRLYECRGRQDGNDIEDWLRAEQVLVRHYG